MVDLVTQVVLIILRRRKSHLILQVAIATVVQVVAQVVRLLQEEVLHLLIAVLHQVEVVQDNLQLVQVDSLHLQVVLHQVQVKHHRVVEVEIHNSNNAELKPMRAYFLGFRLSDSLARNACISCS